MKASDKATLLRTLQSASTSEIEVATIVRVDSSSTQNAMDDIQAFIRAKRADYALIAVRLR